MCGVRCTDRKTILGLNKLFMHVAWMDQQRRLYVCDVGKKQTATATDSNG